ncbi:MAG TPA: aminoacyl-tRNA hydrolase, partial [Gammaproteobacteria bacterium]|nr:aminoacyl-tRNA hydrolase [Gammaproteobacteria bacterium]
MGTQIDLIVGLGNPGPEYATTRHNAGFWFADLLAKENGGTFTSARKLHGDSAEIKIAGHRIRLLKPMTYMNLSGQSVSATINYYKIPVEHVLVAYDELDLPPGRAQLKFDGGSAGHNGVTNVIEHVGSKFWRLRFGVGHPRDKEHVGGRTNVIDHVLKRAGGDEEVTLREKLAEAAALLPVLLEHGAERVKNRLHTRKPET